MGNLPSLLTSPTNILWTAVVSGVISVLVSYLSKRWEIRDKAKVDYEYEQRRRHHELIGRYKGRLLSAANGLVRRQSNLYRNDGRGWLARAVGNGLDGYYFASTAYRFLCVFGLIRQLESEAILLDPRIAKEDDFSFLKYATMLSWVMTDVDLFKGIPYDDAVQKDHFFADEFRQLGEKCLVDGGLMTFDQFKSGPYVNGDVESVLQFFDGLSRGEGRLRWDRLVALNLVLMAFINTFGYEWQGARKEDFKEVASKIQNRLVLRNLVEWLKRHHLADDKEAMKIARAQENLP